MGSLLEALRSGSPLLMDGAMGTQLLSRLGQPGTRLHQLNIQQPNLVRAVHHAYVRAGARVLLTNTFLAHEEAPIRAGVRLAREAIGTSGFVLGAIGPINATVLELESMLRYFEGVDGLLIETASDVALLEKVVDARCNLSLPLFPLLFSATYRVKDDAVLTFSGESPQIVARKASNLGIAALGVNCGKDMPSGRITEVLRAYRQTTNLPLFARPNAGTPRELDSGTSYSLAPEAFGMAAREWIATGATMIGGCCGTEPAHIARCGEVIFKEAGARQGPGSI